MRKTWERHCKRGVIQLPTRHLQGRSSQEWPRCNETLRALNHLPAQQEGTQW
jgi:hypothetical protein